MQIESGNKQLQEHLELGKKNAQYLSPRIQNEIINLCGAVVRDLVVYEVKKADGYSILADETADISGKEQLSTGVRFYDEKKGLVREEFLGFSELFGMDAKAISTAIDNCIQSWELDPDKCVGQGYDGCSSMAGVHNGVHKKLLKKYRKALYYHCASHRLNLVVNDLNKVIQVKNTVATIKSVITFFRESPLRRKYAPNIPALSETRWSQRHKSIRLFSSNFEGVMDALDTLSVKGNRKTRAAADVLYCAASKPEFIICVFMIAKYSLLLEPVVNALQAKSLDLFSCSSHIKRIISNLEKDRENADDEILNLLKEAGEFAELIDVELTVPRTAKRMQYRSNHPSSNPTDYWRTSLLIPYLDSLISSLNERFSEHNTVGFSLLLLHPVNMLKETAKDIKSKLKEATKFYELNNLDSEIQLWYDIWSEKKLEDVQLKNLDLCDVLKEANEFFPAIKRTLHIALAQPCTTCTIERSFSTLRRVKTWLRSTMTEDRLSGKKNRIRD